MHHRQICLYMYNPIMTNHTTTNVITCTCTVQRGVGVQVGRTATTFEAKLKTAYTTQGCSILIIRVFVPQLKYTIYLCTTFVAKWLVENGCQLITLLGVTTKIYSQTLDIRMLSIQTMYHWYAKQCSTSYSHARLVYKWEVLPTVTVSMQIKSHTSQVL